MDAIFSDGHSILSHSLIFHTPVDKFMSESKCESNGTKHARIRWMSSVAT